VGEAVQVGRQVAFYLHPDDHPMLQAWLDERGLFVFPQSVRCAPIERLMTVPAAGDDSDASRLAICSKHDARGFACWYNAKFETFRIDPRQSPVVEFNRSLLDADVLWSGRFWFVPRGFPPDFNEWADALVRWVRRSFVRTDEAYASPAALRWREATGGKLRPGPRALFQEPPPPSA